MALGRAALVQSPDGDLVVSQGADCDFVYRYGTSDGTTTTYVDLTGWDARAQFRSKAGGAVWVDLTTTAVDGTGITLDADGYVRIHLHHTLTEDPAWDRYSRAPGVWDLELIDPAGEVVRLVMGTVTVSADVTR